MNDGKKRNGIFFVDFGEVVIFDDLLYLLCIYEEVFRYFWRGTWFFSSVNVDGGFVFVFCDDLESVIFIFVYLCIGCLLWIYVIDDFGDIEFDV